MNRRLLEEKVFSISTKLIQFFHIAKTASSVNIAVSYTHLDVYKRQFQIFLGEMGLHGRAK